MIRNLFNAPLDALAGALASEIALTPQEAQALHDEVHNDPTGRGYAGKSPEEILALGAAGYFIDNSVTAPPRVHKPFVTGGELAVLASVMQGRKVVALATPNAPPIPAAISYLIDYAIPQVALQASVSTTDPQALGMLQLLIQAGFYTQAEMTNFITLPDPNWTPQVWNEARWTAIFGMGACPTRAEIVTAKG